jgi:predicted RNase H-like HicB family nuclease
MQKTLDDYRRQPYERTFEIREEGSRYFLYRIKEIPIVAGDGATKDEALANLRTAFDDYVTWALEENLAIPEPSRIVTATAPTQPADSVGQASQVNVETIGPRTKGPKRRDVETFASREKPLTRVA